MGNHTQVELSHTVNFLSVQQTAQLAHANSARGVGQLREVEKPTTSFDQAAGKASWENANYKISFNEGMSEMFVQNKNTGENYTVWGDPHVSIGHESENTGAKRTTAGHNQQHDFDFKKDVRFTLEDGTEIHVKTTPWMRDGKEINGATLASQVMIQDGLSDHAFKVTGLDGNGHTMGDMTAREMSGLEVSEADRINDREGLQMLERAGHDVGFSMKGTDGQFAALDGRHRENTSEITAMENFLGQHAIPFEGVNNPSVLNNNQTMVMNQLQQFMEMAMNMFAQQMQVPDGASVFQQISTMIHGQTHTLGVNG